MTKFFQKVVTKNTVSTLKYYHQAEIESFQCINAMENELKRLNTFVDNCALNTMCKKQVKNTDECKWSEEVLHKAFLEFNSVVSQYCTVFLGQSDEKLNSILKDMRNIINTKNPSFIDLSNHIWHIKFLVARLTNEKTIDNIKSYHFFSNAEDIQRETITTNRCTIS